jgi:hypothetical protein
MAGCNKRFLVMGRNGDIYRFRTWAARVNIHKHTHTHTHTQISTNIDVAMYVNLQDPNQKKLNANNSEMPCSAVDFQNVIGSY